MRKVFTQEKSYKSNIVFALFLLILLLNTELSKAEIRFTEESITIARLPSKFLAGTWTFAKMNGNDNRDLVVAGIWQERNLFLKTVNYSGILFINFENGSLRVVGRSLKRQLTTQKDKLDTPIRKFLINRLSHCDLDKDGHEEIYVVYNDAPSCMVTRKNNEYSKNTLPFKDLEVPIIAWFDYDGDGWTDLFLSGAEPVENKENELRGLPGKIFRNNNGRLLETNILIDVPEIVDSAHVIDFDEDGKLDLFLGVATGWNAQPAFNRIFLNKGDRFEEVKLPQVNLDKLMGLSRSRLTSTDLDGDGLEDILISGCWNNRIGPKAFLTLIYRKKYFIEEGKKQFYLEYDHESMRQLPNILGDFIVEDLDNDGDKDIIVSGRDNNFKRNIICLENKESGFERVVSGLFDTNNEPLLGNTYGSVVVPYDVNQDGLIDLVCFPRQSGKKIILLRNVSIAGSQKDKTDG